MVIFLLQALTGAAISQALGGIGGIAQLVALFVFIALEYKAIIVLFFIAATELMFRMDLAGGFSTLSKAILQAFKGTSLVTLVPSVSGSAKTEAQLFRLSSPFKILVNINRGLLYTTFILFFMTAFPFYLLINFPSILVGSIFGFANSIILVWEPLVFSVLLILVVADYLADILVDLTSIVKK